MLSSLVPLGVAIVILATLISHLGRYVHFVQRRNLRQSLARLYLMSDACQNAHLKAQLADSPFSLCAEAERTLSVHPMVGGLLDIAETLTVCGEERCSVFYRDFKSNFPYFVLLLLLLSFLFIWCGRAQRRYTQNLREYERYRLPAK